MPLMAPAATHPLVLASPVLFAVSLALSVTNVVTLLSAQLRSAVTVPA